jgi:hypothetical protein
VTMLCNCKSTGYARLHFRIKELEFRCGSEGISIESYHPKMYLVFHFVLVTRCACKQRRKDSEWHIELKPFISLHLTIRLPLNPLPESFVLWFTGVYTFCAFECKRMARLECQKVSWPAWRTASKKGNRQCTRIPPNERIKARLSRSVNAFSDQWYSVCIWRLECP